MNLSRIKLRYFAVAFMALSFVLSLRISMTDTYSVSVHENGDINLAYLTDFQHGTSPACGCLKQLNDIRGISVLSSSVEIAGNHYTSDFNLARNLFIQSGSLTSINYPAENFDAKVYIIDPSTNLRNRQQIEDVISKEEPIKKFSLIRGLEVLDYSRARVFPGEEFPYTAYLPVQNAMLSMSFDQAGKFSQINQRLPDYEHVAGMPDIGAPNIFPKLEVIGKRILLILEDVGGVRNQHGVEFIKSEDNSKTVIIEINPKFSALLQLVESKGIKDEITGKLFLDLGLEPILAYFDEIPTEDTVSIDWFRHSRAKSDVILNYEFTKDFKANFANFVALSGEIRPSNLPFREEDNSYSFEYRFPHIVSDPALSVWGDLRYLRIRNTKASVTSNLRQSQDVVANSTDGLYISSRHPWNRHKSLDFSLDGSGEINIPRGSLFINDRRFNPLISFARSMEGILTFAAAFVSVLGFVLTFIWPLSRNGQM